MKNTTMLEAAPKREVYHLERKLILFYNLKVYSQYGINIDWGFNAFINNKVQNEPQAVDVAPHTRNVRLKQKEKEKRGLYRLPHITPK